MSVGATAGYLVDELDLSGALAALEARDPGLARRAEAVWQSITFRGQLRVVWQDRLQKFAWHEAPEGVVRGWPAEDIDPSEVAAVAAALFDELGCSGYAAICRSSMTGEVHAAFKRSGDVGHNMAERAEERSGVRPPALDDFSFGHLMGPEELSAHIVVSRSLEYAVTSRQLVVGRSGWRRQQRSATAAALDSPHPQQPGQSIRSVVTTERLQRWVEVAQQRSPEFGDLRYRFADRILHPIDEVDDITTRLAAFLWLLDATAQPEPPMSWPDDPVIRTLAAECHSRRWWGAEFRTPTDLPRDEVPCVAFLMGLAGNTGAIITRKGRRRLTPTGRRFLADPVAAWDGMVAWLGGDRLLNRTIVEIAVLLLLDQPDRSLRAADLWERVIEISAQLGWRSLTLPNEDLTPQERLHSVDWWLFHSMTCGLLLVEEVAGPYLHVADDSAIALTPAGESTFLAYVNHLATGPVTEGFSAL